MCIYIYTCVYIYIDFSVCIYIYIYVCACVCVCVESVGGVWVFKAWGIRTSVRLDLNEAGGSIPLRSKPLSITAYPRLPGT